MKSLRLSGKRAVKSRVRARTALGVSVALVFAATSAALAVSLGTGRIGPSLGTTGKGVEQKPQLIPETTGGDGRVDSLPPVQAGGTAYPEGLAVSPDGKTLAVALNAADSADVVNLATNEQNIVSVGHYPSGVAFDHAGRAYVSNEYDGTLSVIDTATHTVTATISGLGGALGDLAAHPEGLVADPVREQLYVAVTNRDLIAVINTATESISRLISVERSQGIGTEPVKLAVTPDGKTLF